MYFHPLRQRVLDGRLEHSEYINDVFFHILSTHYLSAAYYLSQSTFAVPFLDFLS